ncbi:TetR/AcrR family transcriptional regulator [Kitasatospora viridis]|uniref:TetR family transcriptional regulator n=1 Tax=Kitasatospora viridis TaxID=281105 RepID=A0A561UFT6_9ACTN|nr:TetR/AcrR family transcriptional regulator [Kitasatospora viridis]TWF98229.1 TetR family transcriptional regulator [Kitasatospora viridis]
MARWEPDAAARLERAALQLFVERGYQNVTVVEIAEQAGLTKATFFRHYADKRAVLFGGEEMLSSLLAEAVADAPDGATPLAMVGAALCAVGTAFTDERRELATLRAQAVAQDAGLQERMAYKRTVLAEAIERALRARGTAEPVALVAAQLGVLAFQAGYLRWAVTPDQGYGPLAVDALAELAAATESLGVAQSTSTAEPVTLRRQSNT